MGASKNWGPPFRLVRWGKPKRRTKHPPQRRCAGFMKSHSRHGPCRPKKTGLPGLPSVFQHPGHPGGSGQTESERTGSYPETAPKGSGSCLSIPRAPWQKKHLDPTQYVMNLTGFDATTQGLSPFGNGCESNHSRESHCEKLPNGILV